MTTKTKLTDTSVKTAKPGNKPRKLVDGNAMFLLIGVSGSKTWLYQYKMEGTRTKDLVRAGKVIAKAGEVGILQRTVNLGEYPAVSLKDARTKRDEIAQMVKSGVHPKEHQQQVKAAKIAAAEDKKKHSLSYYCHGWLEFTSAAKKWGDQRKAQLLKYIERYVDGTSLGPKHARDVTVKEIKDLLKSIAYRPGMSKDDLKKIGLVKVGGAPHIATAVHRCLIEAFAEALEEGQCDFNPAASIKSSKVIVKAKVKHNTKLKPPQLAQLVRAIEHANTAERMRIALRLLLLTFVRSSELRCASWPEFDFEKREWCIPAARMKMREPHIVPLSPQAVALLLRLRDICEPTQGQWLFPNRRGANSTEAKRNNMPDAPMASSSFNSVLRRMGLVGPGTVDFTSHGARGTAYTLLSGSGFNDKAIDRQLAHKEPNQVKKAYDASELLPERVKMMDWWADYLQKLEALGVSA